MTRIYTPKEIEVGDVPTLYALAEANKKIVEVITDLKDKSQIIGASSYGSLASPNKLAHVSSDLDWLIVFESLEQMSDSQTFAELIEWLKAQHLDFSNPIVSLDSLRMENHIIGPIIYSIRANSERVIIGKDPVEFFDLERTKLLEIISRLFHTFTRYFYEDIAKYHSTKKDIDLLVDLLQKSLNFFLDTYRSMQILEDDGKEKTNYRTYLAHYMGKLKDDLLEDGARVDRFIAMYKDEITKVLDANNDITRNKYKAFLNDSRDVIMSSARFCRGNIEFFRSKIHGKQT